MPENFFIRLSKVPFIRARVPMTATAKEGYCRLLKLLHLNINERHYFVCIEHFCGWLVSIWATQSCLVRFQPHRANLLFRDFHYDFSFIIMQNRLFTLLHTETTLETVAMLWYLLMFYAFSAELYLDLYFKYMWCTKCRERVRANNRNATFRVYLV